MKIINKKRRQVGATSRLIGNAVWNNGLYIAPTTGMFTYASTMLKKENQYSSLERLRTMRSLKLNLPKDKSIPLYFDEGCNMDEIVDLEQQGYNVVEVIVADYSMGNKAKILCDEFVFGEQATPVPTIRSPQIKKVVYDIPNGTTIVYFADETKEIARVMDVDTFDKEVGVLQCVAKKMYGSRSRFLKDVINKGIVIEKKEKNKRHEEVVDTYLDMFLRGEICVRCNGEERYEFLKILDNTKCIWSDKSKPSEKKNVPYENFNIVYFGCLECTDFSLTWSEMKSDYTSSNCEVVDYQDFVRSI